MLSVTGCLHINGKYMYGCIRYHLVFSVAGYPNISSKVSTLGNTYCLVSLDVGILRVNTIH